MRVFHQNESCLLALSLLHNSREDGGKQGSSHFWWKTFILIGHYSSSGSNRRFLTCQRKKPQNLNGLVTIIWTQSAFPTATKSVFWQRERTAVTFWCGSVVCRVGGLESRGHQMRTGGHCLASMSVQLSDRWIGEGSTGISQWFFFSIFST